jgi:hypothetical protein
VDGEVEGDVAGAEVIVGEHGKVTGTVAAERVIVRGRTSGVIRAMTVALQSPARGAQAEAGRSPAQGSDRTPERRRELPADRSDVSGSPRNGQSIARRFLTRTSACPG